MQDAQPAQPIAGVFTPRLVARLHREGFDGSLRFSTEGATRVLYFRRGEIASAASNAEADRLPNILLLDGRLTEPQLEMARARLAPGVSLGKMLIELGFLTPSELLQGARRQVRQILVACFALTDGGYQISPGPLPPEITVLGLPARRLIFDALLESSDRQAIVREMGSMESVYRRSAAFEEGLSSLRLESSREQVGQTVDGIRTLREISSQTALDDFTVSKVVLALEILGLVEGAGPAATAATPEGRIVPIEVEPLLEAAADPEEPLLDAALPPPLAQGDRVAPTAPAAPATAANEAAEDEPPPFPPGELPAFAVPQGAAPEWRLDPTTGEKSLAGPVEMTFDGRVGPVSEKPFTARRWAAIASVAAVVLVAAVAASLLRSRRPAQQEAVAGAATSQPEAAAELTAGPANEPAPSVSDDDDAGGETGAQPPKPAPSPQKPSAEPASDAAPTHPPASSPGAGQERFAQAQRLIEEGRVADAADEYRAILRAGRQDRFTLQVLIACEASTVQKAAAATGPRGDLIVVPFPLQGRACYRACWGLYDSKEAARAATSSVPAYFADGARQPVVVSLARLVPPA